MNAIKITLLCMLVLIQGISQSYAAQMMMNMSIQSSMDAQPEMSDMPCHQATNASESDKQMQDCCEQDCQCHFLFSAMTQHGFVAKAVKPTALFAEADQTFLSYTSQNLYRPPIFA
ncbi:hypothetical protein NBRC116188_27790 [Oceaniserpentilla sp. 4NH20-0058]|uniref:hypothetical protein n=1 Tax=Oceaniserpentilla sp. 4NH20-0058 TaxID=3127660 RepID=UPI0031021A53